MKTGGYHITDFKGVNIATEGGGTVPGIYEDIEGSHEKAILISGVVLDNVEKRACFVCPEVSAGNFTFTAYGKTFTVTNADLVTFA